MNTYEFQLLLGLVGGFMWGGVFLLWMRGSNMGHTAKLCMVIGFMSALIILPFGSLALMDAIDDNLWFLTGTLLRFVVVVAGVVALTQMED